jgi:putative ATP-grasp target RiPP
MSSSVQTEPFGLSFRVSMSPSAIRTEAVRNAVYDQQRQMALFNGRPLSELTAQEQMVTSSSTETDGKDPISVDTDPLYD